MIDYAKKLAAELNQPETYVAAAIRLIDEGNTVPFIARYRKEATNSMDDQALRVLGERLEYLRGLDRRRAEVEKSITEQGALTPALSRALESAATLAELEDLYRPYKPKRKTRASAAKARGLGPLAEALLAQNAALDVRGAATRFLSDEVPDAESALAGARDILAEGISDDAKVRAELRRFFHAFGRVTARAAKEGESVYEPYYDFAEPVAKIAPHRVLALDRGEREGWLKVSVEVEAERGAAIAVQMYARQRTGGESAQQVRLAAEDAYKRLLAPSLETEIRAALTENAAEGAIRVFGENLRQLLLQPPIKGKVALGMDPGYRMGCKLAVVDATGKVLDTAVVFPTPEFKKVEQAKTVVKGLIRRHGVQILAIGNGTAGRETELFAAEVIRELGGGVQYMVVSEAGASVYSASPLAAAEFPQYDTNLRSAVSIARRLQDPLAELVKIDPKAVGVGQYQHDMPQKRLDETLDGVVEDCVNTVGVDLNTASAPLLNRVAGLSRATAQNIVEFREENGAFVSRAQLKKVRGLGPRAFEQCAGFLRIPQAKNRLDETAVHPESYAAAKELLAACGYTEADIGTPAIAALPEKMKAIGEETLCARAGVGAPTLRDIAAELLRPGRDMRDTLPQPLLRSDVLGMEDLKPGMLLTGTVRNVIDFGAFVDIGVHQDGLVHISQIRDTFVRRPGDVLRVGQVVQVKVLEVDLKKKRIALTMKGVPQTAAV
jgi:uncharacterized protein